MCLGLGLAPKWYQKHKKSRHYALKLDCACTTARRPKMFLQGGFGTEILPQKVSILHTVTLSLILARSQNSKSPYSMNSNLISHLDVPEIQQHMQKNRFNKQKHCIQHSFKFSVHPLNPSKKPRHYCSPQLPKRTSAVRLKLLVSHFGDVLRVLANDPVSAQQDHVRRLRGPRIVANAPCHIVSFVLVTYQLLQLLSGNLLSYPPPC